VSWLDARRPAVVFANALGDNLLTLMALRALASLFPGRLELVSAINVRRLFFADVEFGAVHEVDFAPFVAPSGNVGRSFDAAAVAARLTGCDLLLSLNPWTSPSLRALREALAPARSLGFLPGFDVSLPVDAGQHAARLAFELPRQLRADLRLESFAAPLQLSRAAGRPAALLRQRLPAGTRLLVVHADTKPEKMWAADRFATLLDGFLTDHRDVAAVIVGARDTGLGALADRHPVLSCLGLPLDVTMALVGAADLFVGVDSCMLHAADLFRVPGVGLFGPTHSAEFGFLFAPHRHIDAQGPLDGVPVERVREALESLV
jgi:ADP-heptose:LPS heptosyltransferase